MIRQNRNSLTGNRHIHWKGHEVISGRTIWWEYLAKFVRLVESKTSKQARLEKGWILSSNSRVKKLLTGLDWISRLGYKKVMT